MISQRLSEGGFQGFQETPFVDGFGLANVWKYEINIL